MVKKPNRKGAPLPPYTFCSVLEAFQRYERELAGTYVSDPLGVRVWFMDYNFPKLIQLCFDGKKAKALKTIAYLRLNSPDISRYSCDQSRMSTLFWLPELIGDPDSIHANCHARIVGDEIYVRRYAKAGACFKIAFTVIDEELNQRVVTTAFLTSEDRLKVFIQDPPKWMKKIKKDPIPTDGKLPFPKE